MKKKSLALFLALALVLVGAIGGTLAWLTDSSDEVVNTFTDSDIDITLTETAKDFKMVPGYTISKDPKVTVKAGSEKCYLFVELKESANFDSFLTYEIADGWTALPDVANVYYRVVDTADMGTAYSVLKDDQVTVLGTVTKEMMNGLTEADYPTLTVTAYASQYMSSNDTNFTPAQAWTNISPTTP